jgi:ribosomal protein S18 acetylase RimI-like enzyme
MTIPDGLYDIGPAKPDDSDIAWKLIYDTDPDLFDYYFNNDTDLMKSCLSDWWQRPEGWFSHSSCTAAIYNGSPAGIEIGFSREDFQKHTRPTFYYAKKTMSRAAFEHFSDAFRNYVPYLFPFIPRDAYYVQSLATRAEIRGQGVGHKLLNTAFKRTKEMGLISCQLDVVSDSIAVNFYRKMGMEVLAVTRMPYLEKNYGISAHYRMRKVLE